MTETGIRRPVHSNPITIRRKVQSLTLPRPSRLSPGEVAGALTQSVQLINNILEEPADCPRRAGRDAPEPFNPARVGAKERRLW
jgi:hypothetical protein